MVGHVFVVRGDLTRLACDALLIPCDDDGNVSDVWCALLPPDLNRVQGTSWIRLLEAPGDDHSVHVVSRASEERTILAVSTVGTEIAEPDDVVHRTETAIRAATTGLVARDGRHRPLLALPLVGTGEAGLQGRRGEVIDKLLPALERLVSVGDADIALVLHDRRDFAAVQARRGADDWPYLERPLIAEADSLGARAAAGQLSLFLGAGLSRPAGLPDWWELLRLLALEAGVSLPAQNEDPLAAASALAPSLKGRLHQHVAEILRADKHALGHALLAGLGVRQVVTTNFDVCMELALEPILGSDGVRVMTKQIADAGSPWLLKLHGDVQREGSLVLTTEHYQAHEEDYRALHGVVQSLMLTSHLLFVGFGMTDANFLKMARAVARVRTEAINDQEKRGLGGTALALLETDLKVGGLEDLRGLAMEPSGDHAAAARKLEIFLDRLAWAASQRQELKAEYLLDDRYTSALTDDDQLLRSSLETMLSDLPDQARESVGWPRVQELLTSLGREDR